MAYKVLACCTLWLIVATSAVSFAQTAVVGPDTLLNQEADISQLPVLSSNTALLASSYDRTGGNADFGNYVSSNGTRSVLADLKGPGAVVRIWSANPSGTLKIYIDDNPLPVVDQPFSRLFDNSTPPFQNPLSGMSSGGFYCYIPMTFAKHCVISTDSSPSLYYQVTSLSFPPTTVVRPFALPITAADAAALDNANESWWGEASNPAEPTINADRSIAAGKSLVLGSYNGPGRVHEIRLNLPGTSDSGLRKLVLRAHFDNHTAPDIEVPEIEGESEYARPSFARGTLIEAVMRPWVEEEDP